MQQNPSGHANCFPARGGRVGRGCAGRRRWHVRIAHVSDSHLTNPEGVATSVGTTVALLRAAGYRVVL